MLIEIDNMESGDASKPRDTRLGMQRPTDALIPKLISSLKRFTNRFCNKEIWQDSYYDHIIRDDNDYLTHWRYIDNNPAKWAEDEYYVK